MILASDVVLLTCEYHFIIKKGVSVHTKHVVLFVRVMRGFCLSGLGGETTKKPGRD